IDSEIILKEDLESHKPWTQVTEFQVPLEWLEQTFQNKSNAGTSKCPLFFVLFSLSLSLLHVLLSFIYFF
ncbi:hypothetical protein HMI54_010686, partial [Coelomomyces lativittatus]